MVVLSLKEFEDFLKDLETLCITGHRPRNLPWGYDESRWSCRRFKRDLKKMIKRSIAYGKTNFMCGLALGVDMIFAETVLELKVKYPHIKLIGAIPCKNQDCKWNYESRERYARLLESCDYVYIVSEEYTPTCMNERNKFIVNHSSTVIAVWNGRPSGTGNTVRFAQTSGCEIIVVDPNMY